MKPILSTARLTIQQATLTDADLFYEIWTNPEIMKMVGFPKGLNITMNGIRTRLEMEPDQVFNRLLVAVKTETNETIGECHMHPPNEKGIAGTDIKLLPKFWGNKFGVEIKKGLLEYLFENSDCIAVEATPNVQNIASIKMQEAVNGCLIKTVTYNFPENMQQYTCPVKHHIYHVTREIWRTSKSI